MLHRIISAIREWRATSTTIEQLSALSDKQLSDIGIKRGQIPDIARSRRIVLE